MELGFKEDESAAPRAREDECGPANRAKQKNGEVGDGRLERNRQPPSKTLLAASSYAPDYAVGPNSQLTDQELAEVVAAWRWLPDSAKAEIARLVRASQADGRPA